MTYKKIGLIIGVLCLMLSMQGIVFANKFIETDTVTMTNPLTGVTGNYQPVNLMMGGEDVITDVPGILYTSGSNTRTLVPISFIVDRMGAKISWQQDTREITIDTEGKHIVMQIDNAYATVNGTKTKLPDGIAPILLAYGSQNKTFVPVKFISEQLGLEVNWIGDTRTVAINKPVQTLTDVYLDYLKQFPEIRMKVTGEVDATSFVISGSDVGEQDKIVIDLQNTKFELDDPSMLKNGVGTYRVGDGIFGIDRVEISLNGTNPPTTRATVYLDEKRGHRVFYDEATHEMVIQLINTVNDVQLENTYGTDTVVIETSERPAYNINLIGDQIVVDVFNSILKVDEGMSTIVPINKGKIESYGYSQLDTSQYGTDDLYTSKDVITRVAIALTETVSYDDIYIEDDGTNIKVFVAQNPLNNFDYVRMNTAKSNMSIHLFEGADFTKTYDSKTRTLTLKLPVDSTDLNDFTYPVDDNIVRAVNIARSGDQYVVSIQLIQNTTYADNSTSSDIIFAFTNNTILNSNYKDTLIVIDPGHGGHDSGAVGTLAKEKDLALQASLSLENQLKQLGFKVYMTRSKDEYPGLYDRADIANDLNADLFVSVHINAHTNTAATGVEVLCNSESMTGGKGLATAIQKELVSDLNAVDRGVVQRPNLVVLRETKMPSVLCELGFISNESDQAKLMDPAYLDKAAGAIVDGIVKFLK
ncbi:MAG: N-acetylmuramoyl-L-alanine amidase [Clostridiales bacterium]|nr:N-acetylmuramoyl-L-alanine amidase [Clostridiales bacterium]MDN5298859.1 N-acetylmuramoyl-L-alanine amidase [Clostridiales bacterium]